MTALVELEEIRHDYGPVRALAGVTLTLSPGTIGLVGRNGAGKSTLMQILLGLIRPTYGAARVLGEDVRAAGVALRGRIGYMPERDALVPGLRGVEYAALAGQLCGMSRRQSHRRAHEVLSYFGLDEARYRPLEQYSTGMKQRLKLAAAVMPDPELLLLDEPTSGLDPQGRVAMLEVLKLLAARPGRSLVLSSHLLGDIERVCETAVILEEGGVAAVGRLVELRRSQERVYRLQWDGASDEAARGFLERLAGRGAEVEPDLPAGAARIIVPYEWRCHWFFQDARPHRLVLTQLVPEEEDLATIYRRVLSGRDARAPADARPMAS